MNWTTSYVAPGPCVTVSQIVRDADTLAGRATAPRSRKSSRPKARVDRRQPIDHATRHGLANLVLAGTVVSRVMDA